MGRLWGVVKRAQKWMKQWAHFKRRGNQPDTISNYTQSSNRPWTTKYIQFTTWTSICFPNCYFYIVLATGPNSWVSLGSSSTANRTVLTSLSTPITWTIGNGPVLPPKTRHFKFTILAPIKYLSSDCTMTWSVRTLCSFSHSFTSRCQICNWTNIRWVAIEKPQISRKIWCYFTVIQQILVWLQIWKREVEERLKLHNLYIDHVMIWWDLRYLIGAKVAGTVKWNSSAGTTQPTHMGLCLLQVTTPPRQSRPGFCPGRELNRI